MSKGKLLPSNGFDMKSADLSFSTDMLRSLVDITDRLAPIVYGIVQPGQGDPEGVPFVQSRDVGGHIVADQLEKTSPKIAAQYSRSTLEAGDIIFSLRGNIGESSIASEELNGANIARGVARIRVKSTIDNHFVRYVLQSPHVRQRIDRATNGSTFKEISIHQLREIKLPIPTLPEQQKISAVLRAWDENIDNVCNLIALLRKNRSLVYNHIFESIYLPGDHLRRAKEVFLPISERARPDLPLLAVMQEIGIVRRDELDRRVAMPDGDTSAYKVVRPGDFVISLRSFEGGLEYSTVHGLVSPAYTVLRPTHTICASYYRHYFKSRSFIGRLDKMIFGIRDGKQIAFRDFGDMLIPEPHVAVQQQHAQIMDTASKLIELNVRKKVKLELQKRGLMQKLLTGQWRVKV